MKRSAKLTIFVLVLVFVGFGVAIAFAQSADPREAAAKLEAGAYYWAGAAWQPLEPLTWSANGIQKDGKSYVWSYRHPQARVQLTGRSPLFFLQVRRSAWGAEPATFSKCRYRPPGPEEGSSSTAEPLG